MSHETPEIGAARQLADQAAQALARSTVFCALDHATQQAILRDLSTVRQALAQPQAAEDGPEPDPYALSLDTPTDYLRRRLRGSSAPSPSPPPAPAGTTSTGKAKAPTAATETLAARQGALQDEIDFPGFVAGLIHGTFDAIVDASIRQMEAFADLVSAVAKSVDQFTSENVTPNQVRDWLVDKHPADLVLELPAGTQGQPRLRPRTPTSNNDDDGFDSRSPAWLADYGLAGEQLTEELIEQSLLPAARRQVGESRQQLLATMVLLGMNRINVRDGRISARVRIRAAARDRAKVDYAVAQDPGAGDTGSRWGTRGSATYSRHTTMVSTLGVNAQTETNIKAELFGEVRINFASETMPLERFADAAQMTLLQRHARWTGPAPATGTEAPATATPAPAAPTPAIPTPATPAPATPTPATPTTPSPAAPPTGETGS